MIADTFVRDHLPGDRECAALELGVLAYPERLNCVAELLDCHAAAEPERPALWYRDAVWSYGRLADTVQRVARVLVEELGLVPGGRVLLRGYNTPMMVACWLAVARAGGVVVATMPLLRAGELAYMVGKARIALCLCEQGLEEEAEGAGALDPRLARIVTFSAQGAGDAELDRALAAAAPGIACADTPADEPVLIAFTSGTTGKAKGTVHTHRDMLAVCDTFARQVVGVRADDIFVGTPPIAFTFGLGALVLFPLRAGASSVLVEKLEPETILATVERYRATGLWTAPTAYRAMAPLAGGHDLASLRLAVSAGEHLPRATWEAWKEATNIAIIDGIGSTEMLHVFISASGAAIRPGATGLAVPGYRAAILDLDGNELPSGEEGWLAVRGPTRCRYLDDPARQRGYVRAGWNVTGDIYRRDDEGYFWFVARGDDMIISAGYNISAPEVENALLAHPDVAEVAVVAMPDAERGHIVAAFVVTRLGVIGSKRLADALKDHVKRTIAPYKYPRRIEFREWLPRTPTGKLQRFKLREEAERLAWANTT